MNKDKLNESKKFLNSVLMFDKPYFISQTYMQKDGSTMRAYAVGMVPATGMFKIKRDFVNKDGVVTNSDFATSSYKDVVFFLDSQITEESSNNISQIVDKKDSRAALLKRLIKISEQQNVKQPPSLNDLFLQRFLSQQNPIDNSSSIELKKMVQEALKNKGFNIGRYGADGIFGKDTLRAINEFKKTIGKNQDGKIYPEDMKLLIGEQANNKSYEDLSRETFNRNYQPTDKTVYFGDSQMGGGVGKALVSSFGAGDLIFKNGSSPSGWVNDSSLMKLLSQMPKKIIINLGGNSIEGATSLLEKIKKVTPKSKIIWFGAPPVIKTSNRGLAATIAFNNKRNARNQTLESLVPQYGGIFVNPFNLFDQSEISKGTAYSCRSCDGVHMPESVAKERYASVSQYDTGSVIADAG